MTKGKRQRGRYRGEDKENETEGNKQRGRDRGRNRGKKLEEVTDWKKKKEETEGKILWEKETGSERGGGRQRV